MADRVAVAPQMLTWARARSGRGMEAFSAKFPKLPDWETGELLPTFRQLEAYARATHTPIGFFFLPSPPVETLPIPDFRTIRDIQVLTPSPDLLDTIYICQHRQDWYREFAESEGAQPVSIVGSLTSKVEPIAAASILRDILGFDLEGRRTYSNWTQALGGLIDRAENLGILVMISGIVGSNTHRVLNPEEFRGFALVDSLAPVIFVNGADTKAAQIFTLAHEIAHVALGQSAVSRPDLERSDTGSGAEQWCNQVAAEILVPIASITGAFDQDVDLSGELDRLARLYKVSTLVVLRRIFDSGQISYGIYRQAYPAEFRRVMGLAERVSSGGNFYNTQPIRVSKRFARALIADTIDGRTQHRDAFRLLGFKKTSAFDELGNRLGVA